MRIAFITFEYPPRLFGGAGVYAESLVCSLAKLGHEIDVYAPSLTEGELERPSPRVKVHRVRIPRDSLTGWISFCLKVTKRLEKARPEERADVVHINGIGFFAFRDRVHGPAYISTAHHLSRETAKKGDLSLGDRILDVGGENGFLIPLVERYGVRFPDRYIAVSRETKGSLMSLYDVPDSLVDVVWNGVDLKGAPIGPQDRESLRSSLGLPSGKLLVFVGRVDDPRKDLTTVIRALAQIPSEARPTLIAVGAGHTAKAEALAKELGVLDRLSFRGRVGPEELWGTYLVADVCVCASRQEGFGLTILEALCAGCKVISTEVGVVPEIRGKIEAVVPFVSPEAMGTAIAEALRGGSKPSRVEVVVPYELSWERSAKQTLAAYEKAVGSRRKR
ncbi:MAG TPA: glycosyltransferase family 4 protein [Methanomassiliicoccales archaeon]|nr:glycosyltransferase family 4 protein [Methanomassiliicoccales archaeon]